MSLQVWLPLNGNLENKGLDNISISSTDAIVDNSGKTGKCMKVVSSTSLGYIPDFNTKSISLCGWFKFNRQEIKDKVSTLSFTDSKTTPTGNLIGNNSYGGIGIIWNGNNYYSSNDFTSMSVFGYIRTATTSKSTSSFSIDFDTWIHIALVWNVSTRTISLYKNGVLLNSQTVAAFSDGVSRALSLDYAVVYGGNGPGCSIPMRCNDVRIYDHCLSQQEIHEISKALVLHYKLDEKTVCSNTVNLVANGWGGTENWSNSNVFTNELPTGLSPAPTHSYKNNYTKQFIPINPSHSYTMSSYVKSYDNNPSYLALVPYDIDKLQINNYNTASGFKATSLTTLKQPLRPGDTVIYLADNTDMSNWTSTRYQNMVALFGYRDSTGHIYPDLYYTRRTYSYRSSASNVDTTTNIDFTNKTVTLLNPYSGKETIPAGTSICLTTQGSIYFYPSSLSAANSTDWTLLSNTFTPSAKPYLNGVRYVKVCAMSQNYSAAISLVDNNATNIVYDTSGYENNGTITGTLSFAENTPRYKHSTLFNSSGILSTYTNYGLSEFTYSAWIKLTSYASERSCISIGGTYFTITNGGKLSTYAYGKSPAGYHNGSITIPLNTWTHVALVWTTDKLLGYVNGVKDIDISCTGTFTSGVNHAIGSEYGTGSSRVFSGYISDLREYATALSADDILDLYNSSGNVDDCGTMGFYECNEESHNMLFDQNIGILTKTWVAGLSKYNQANCQCTLTDDGYRIYRTPNLTYPDSGTVMWGGLVIDNPDNMLNLQDNHTYLVQFEIKGQSSNAMSDISWSNYVGWGTGGLVPSPSGQLKLNPVVENFNSNEWKTLTYKWTINDGLYKTCTSSYSTYVAGNKYLSYKGLKFGFGYASTGTLGTDLYIKNIRMFDITNDVEIELNKEGVMKTKYGIEEPTFREIDLGGLKFEQLIEY